jgi:hypothetical protein
MDPLSWLTIETSGGTTGYRPGDRIEGMAGWHLERQPRSMELRLFWYTEGRGTQDVEIVDTVSFEAPGAEDRRSFSLALPAAPYSFSGKLISLTWALELVAEPRGESSRLEITVSPTGAEVLLFPGLHPNDAPAR